MVFGKQKYIFPIENNHANNAYHESFHPVCDGFFVFVDDIVPLRNLHGPPAFPN